MNEILNVSVEELLNQVAKSQITSVEICNAFIQRIEKFENDVNAFAHFD